MSSYSVINAPSLDTIELEDTQLQKKAEIKTAKTKNNFFIKHLKKNFNIKAKKKQLKIYHLSCTNYRPPAMSISVKILVKNYAIADFALSYYAIADFANAKNAKIILHKHEKQHKNTRKHTHAQQGRKRAKISEKTAEKRKKRDDIQRSK